MITVFDSSNYAQQVFLKEAYATLAAQGNILNQAELDAGKFLSLDGYFAHMQELVSLRPSYVLIPSDEEPFEINANTRDIKVPTSSFGKCAGVVGDNMCEIITFTIDRYFDYVDLANANICIQWKLPAAPGEEAEEGISHIGLRDLITTSGKIRFGWPLTKELTKNAGNITFAVRFYKEKVVADEAGENKTQFVYLFNTKTATIPIIAGLNIAGENVIVEQGVTDLFADFVENSMNPTYQMPTPVAYVNNLPEKGKIDETKDEMVLRAQATTSGDGHIVYQWYLKERCSDRTDLTAIATPITGEEAQFTVNHNDYISVGTDWSKLTANKQYYMANVAAQDGEEAPGNMTRVTYKLVNNKPTFVTYKGEPIAEGTELFERYSTLTIIPVPAEDAENEAYTKITGLYHVKARNVVGEDTITVTNVVDTENGPVTLTYKVPGINSTNDLPSNECYLPTPAEIVIADGNNLPKDKLIKDAATGAVLKVTPNKDDGNPMRTYTWYRYVEGVSEDEYGNWVAAENAVATQVGEAQVNAAVAVLDTLEPGWYYVNINSLLNRATVDADSSIVRVVNAPEKPQVMDMEYFPWGLQTPNSELTMEEWLDTTMAEYGNYVLKDNAVDDENGYDSAINGSVASLRVTIKDDLNSLLKSDEISYEWYVIAPDSTKQEGIPVTADMMGSNSNIHEINTMNTNILNVRCTSNVPDKSGAYAYYCKITNKLANETNTFDFKDYKVTFLVY